MIHVVCHGNFAEYIRINSWKVTEKEGGVCLFKFYLFEKQKECGNNQTQDIEFFDFREASGQKNYKKIYNHLLRILLSSVLWRDSEI